MVSKLILLIMDLLVKKSRVQQRKRGVPHWSSELEAERKNLKELNKIAIETKNVEDIRGYKNAKNVHTRNVVKHQKRKFKENMAKVERRWTTLKDVTPVEDATPTEINYRGKTLTSPKEIAESYAEFLDTKTEKIREEITKE